MTNHVQMCSLSVEMMKEKGLTEGAAKKLHKKLEELRLVDLITVEPKYVSLVYIVLLRLVS